MKTGTISISVLLILLTSCTGTKSLVDVSEPFSESTQRAYFTGQKHLIKGDLEAAYSSFQVCVEAEPEAASFYFDLAKIDYQLGRLESALMNYNLAIELDASNDWYYYHRGITLLDMESYKEAWLDLASWITERPSDLEALEMCSTMFIRAGELELAYKLLSYYEDAIAHNPEVRQMRFHLLLEINPDPSGFNKFIDEAIEDFPDDEVLRYERALVKIMMGDNEAAITLLEELFKSQTSIAEVTFALADCYLAAGRNKEAEPLLEKAFSDDTLNPKEKINTLLKLTDYDQIARLLELGTAAHPDYVELFLFSGIHFLNKNDLQNAAIAFKKATILSPQDYEARLHYLSALTDMRFWDKVALESENAMLVFPLEPAFYYYNGFAHKSLKNHHSAISSFLSGLTVVIDAPSVGGQLASELAFSLREVGEFDKSYEAFEESLAYVEDPFVMNNHAYFLALDNVNMQDALKWSTRANNEMPNEPNFLDTQALILHLLDRNEEALELIKLASSLLEDNQPDAVFLEREGDILWALNEKLEARKRWEAAITAGGGKKRLGEKLNQTVAE
jgi:tetratricopeptide (TPR) repeat protein